ncbi:hypothetical protein JAAARDRAFT_523193 [Jaapia argillacea MUCL 33604]|uniref:Uncharacterized protein n=1 Tax=Jaapia argillacea MUCL 33604 TaxID=933084 RepID=A0A067QE75_9AGAM|nr:hypothetical protein JAAARDRAFT_523193 [Jaapia argillacea MUCL 33604]
MEPISPGEGPSNSPNIYVTQAAHSQNNFPTPTPSSSFNLPTLHHHSSLSSLHSLSPGSSPTTGEFPSHIHSHTPSLSRQTSYQSLPYDNSHMHGRYDNGLPPSPGSHTQRPLEPFPSDYSDGRPGSAKRQRMAGHHSSMNSPHPHDPHNAIVNGGEAVTRKLARARSDSAPLGYALGATWANQGRPRSGSGLAAGGRVTTANMMRKEDSLVQNIANTGRVGPQGGAIGKQSPAQ